MNVKNTITEARATTVAKNKARHYTWNSELLFVSFSGAEVGDLFNEVREDIYGIPSRAEINHVTAEAKAVAEANHLTGTIEIQFGESLCSFETFPEKMETMKRGSIVDGEVDGFEVTVRVVEVSHHLKENLTGEAPTPKVAPMNETNNTPKPATVELTAASRELFFDYVTDAPNWSGTPMVGGNVGGSKADAGNLTDLKKKGLVDTWEDEGCAWLKFTELGEAFARAAGYDELHTDAEWKDSELENPTTEMGLMLKWFHH